MGPATRRVTSGSRVSGRARRRVVKEEALCPVEHLYFLLILGRSVFPPEESEFRAAVASALSTEVESGAGLVGAGVFRHNQSKCLTYIKVSQNGRTEGPRPGSPACHTRARRCARDTFI